MIFQIIAFFILFVFYGCYFAKMAGQKKKGIQTYQLGSDKTGLVRFIEIAVSVCNLLAPAAMVISILLDTAPLPLWARILGICFGVLGDICFVCAVVTMKDSWRAGVSKTDKTELVTDGIYQISRNPAFLGFSLVYLGITLLFFNWVLFAVSILAALMLHLQVVNVEEDFLIETFGDAYLDYKRRVNRYLGRKRK